MFLSLLYRLKRLFDLVSTLVFHTWRFRFARTKMFVLVILNYWNFAKTFDDDRQTENLDKEDTILEHGGHVHTDPHSDIQTKFMVMSHHGTWEFFCRTLYEYSMGQDAWYKYMYRYNLYQNQQLPPYSTTYAYVNEGYELKYLGRWSMWLMWRSTNIYKWLGLSKISGQFAEVWKWRKLRSVTRRFLNLPTILLFLITTTHRRCLGILVLSIASTSKRVRKYYDHINLPNKGSTYLLKQVLFITATALGAYHCTTNFSTWFILNFVLLIPALLLWQTFVFFFKTYRISKYTSANQRFWKRSLSAFWALEVFLFLIATYIWFNAPSNLYWGVLHGEVVKSNQILPTDLLDMTLTPALLLVLSWYLIFINMNGTPLVKWVTLATINGVLGLTTVVEYLQLVEVFSRTNSNVANFSMVDQQGLVESLVMHERAVEDLPRNQATMLVTFLKFWHILFIAVYCVFVTIRKVEVDYYSYDTASSLLVNTTLLMVFNLISVVYSCKKILFFFFTTVPYCMVLGDPMGILTSVFVLVMVLLGIY